MIACVDTHYEKNSSRTAIVVFEDWNDSEPLHEHIHLEMHAAAEYVPGELFKRELPGILAVIMPFRSILDTIVVDGYVWLNQVGRKGLGPFYTNHSNRGLGSLG